MIFDVNGLKIHVEVKGNGFPVVMLHGFTGDTTTWSDVVGYLEKESKVILIDLIGHGKTSSPAERCHYDMDQVVEVMKDLLRQLEVEEVDFVGYSMGGRTALAFAMNYPSMVRKLVLESASPGLETEVERLLRRQKDEELANLIERNGLEWFVQYWENIPLFASQKRLPFLKQQRIKEQRKQNSIKGLANSLRGMGTGAQSSYWKELRNYRGDVLLVTGEEDSKFVGIAKKMQKEFEKCQYVNFANCGHAIHVEEPAKFGTIVSGFLSKADD